MPIITSMAGDSFNQKFQFSQGDNIVVSSIEALDDEKTLVQNTVVTIDGDRHAFSVTHFWDGKKSESEVKFTSIHPECKKKWKVSEPIVDIASGDWYACGDPQDLASSDVQIEIATSFNAAESSWKLAGADVRSQFWIDINKTYYTTYIDFDELVLVGTFWQNGEMLARGEW